MGADIQNAIDTNATGTVFCLPAGTWTGQQLDPALGDQFIGDPDGGTILTGGDETQALCTDSADKGAVVFENITVEHYNTSTAECYLGAIHGATNWTFLNDTFSYNNCTGLVLGANSSVIGGRYIYNLHAGLGSCCFAGILVQGAEIAWNNTRGDDPTNDASGLKFANTDEVQVLDNWVHDNYANGLWFDIASTNTTIQGNTVIDNAYEGIRYEVSGGTTYITNNVVNDNGAGAPPGYSNEQIGVYSSDHVQVANNNVATWGPDAIIIQADVRTDYPSATTQDDVITGNRVTFTGDAGAEGFRDYGGPLGADGLASITSDDNTFDVVSVGDAHWDWDSQTTPTDWISYLSASGQDSNSTLGAGNGSIAGCQQTNCSGSGAP